MFDLTPISTTNLFTLAQMMLVIVGFVFAVKSLNAARESVRIANTNLSTAGESLRTAGESLKTAGENVALATKNAQAQLVNQMIVQGRDLQFKHMDIFLGGTGDLAKKQSAFTGALLGYHAACFELRNVLELPPHIKTLLDADLRELMREPYVREKWDAISQLHSQRFIEHVSSLRGVK